MMCYPRGKVFVLHIASEQPAYGVIDRVVRTSGLAGIKKYFWAKRLDDETLAVHTTSFPGQEQSW